jgi:hypothetical protein
MVKHPLRVTVVLLGIVYNITSPVISNGTLNQQTSLLLPAQCNIQSS